MIVECIDDTARPTEIPISKWVKKGLHYEVVHIYDDMHGIELYELEEVDLRSLGTSYKGFAATRFRFIDDGGLVELYKELNLENA